MSKDKQKVPAGEESILEQYIIDDLLHIPSREETVIEGMQIVIRDDIKCEGKLVFKKCIIHYNGDNICSQIHLGLGSTLVLSQCTVVGKNNEVRDEKKDKYFINGDYLEGEKKKANLEAEKCLFLDCLNFTRNISANFKDSVIRYTKTPVALEKEESSVFNVRFTGDCCITEISGSLVEMEIEADKNIWFLNHCKGVYNCTFRNLKDAISVAMSGKYDIDSDIPVIKNCYFNNCSNPISGLNAFIMHGCVFENCTNTLELKERSNVSNCQFIDCGGKFINVSLGDVVIQKCEFINAKEPVPFSSDDPIVKGLHELSKWNESGIHLYLHKENQSVLMQNCTFDGINQAGFITYTKEKNTLFDRKSRNISIKDCLFKHCVAGVIDRKNHASDKKEAIAIINCTGVEETGGGQAVNPIVWEKTAEGEPIGTNIKEADVGFPQYRPA